MFTKENTLIERFTRGLTSLTDQIKLKNLIRYQDDNITAEQFICRLMNILYDMDYHSSNGTDGLTPGYDLFSARQNEIIQVSSTCDGDKINDACRKVQNAIRDGKIPAIQYRLRFVFLVNDASVLKTCAAARRAKVATEFTFDPEQDILDFKAFAARVKTEFLFEPEKADRLRDYMDYCIDVFPPDITAKPHDMDRVGAIISEYASNFDEPLFMHLFSIPPVTLRQLYVAPSFYRHGSPSRDMEGSLRQYINDDAFNRERFFFIEGSAAIGKTSLVSWLCWHYQNLTETATRILGSRKIVCVRLRELEFQGNSDAEQVFLNYLKLPHIETFERRYRDALLILDGADELSMVRGIPHGDVEAFLIALQRRFRSHKFLITTRPQFLNMNRFNSAIFQYRKIELAHYDEEMRAEWLDRYKACGQTVPENTERFIRSLRGREENGVADTPLALYLLAQCNAEADLLGNHWALYHRIFSLAILKGEYNTSFFRNGDLLDERSSSVNYRVVQSIAFRIFRNATEERYYLNEQEIMEAISECDLENLTPDRVRETCVLCSYWKNVGSIGALEFYHNNIRDFFLCEYLCDRLISCLQAPDPLEALIPMLCRMLCHADICRSTWKQVYEYLCLRLNYESVKPQAAGTLYHLVRERKDILCQILPRLTAGRELWNTKHDPIVYRGAKQIFRNIFMLVRILQSFCPGKIELTPDDFEASSMFLMETLHDWTSMFQTPEITYTDTRGFLVNIDATSNTDYQYLGLSERQIANVHFDQCNIAPAYFLRSTLNRISFRYTNLFSVDLPESIVKYCEFVGAHLTDVNWDDATISHTLFNNATLTNVRGKLQMSHCNICHHTSLVHLKLDGSSFTQIHVLETQISDSSFIGSSFVNALIEDSTITQTDLKGIAFDGRLQNIVFDHCLFNHSTFARPYTFQNVTFRNCRFNYVSFRGIDLSTVTFDNCDLQYAEFS
jgi:uncharacterized protein YjbI with pentapeptide repeats